MFKKMSAMEKKLIFEGLLKSHGTFLIKADTEEVIQAQLHRVEEDSVFCIITVPLTQTPQDNQVIVNFAVDEERYFMQTTMKLDRDFITLDTRVPVFQLQRRKTIRIELPDEMESWMTVIELNGKKVNHEGRLLDFSAGGCRLSYNRMVPFFAVNDRMKCILKIFGRQPIDVEVVVRHTFAKGERPELPQILGLQFDPIRGHLQTRLATLFMDLQKEIFNKYHADK